MPRTTNALKGDEGPSLILQWIAPLAVFLIISAVLGSLIFSQENINRATETSIGAYRLAAGVNLLNAVPGGTVQKQLKAAVTFTIDGTDISAIDGAKVKLENYLFPPANMQLALPAAATRFCVEKPLGGTTTLKTECG